MRSRILDRLQVSGEMSLFVGNVHRFCSNFIFENNVVARDTTVIDEQESLSIMASIFGWDEGFPDQQWLQAYSYQCHQTAAPWIYDSQRMP